MPDAVLNDIFWSPFIDPCINFWQSIAEGVQVNLSGSLAHA